MKLCLIFLSTIALTTLGFIHEVNAQSMRTIEGRYVRIITDLPPTPERDQWTAAVDAAVPVYCDFWQVPLEQLDRWRVTAYVMSAKEPFLASGGLPSSIPDFAHGYQIGNNIWLLVQPSEYYTRHLLLHEVAHAFAFEVFGGAGPPWFMEGTAEFLATHRWDGQQLEVGVVPESSASFPYWGRFKMIDRRRQQAETLSLISVLRYSDTAHRQVEPYAWTWAAIQLFASRPETKKVLVDAARDGRDASPDFTRRFVDSLGPEWPLAQLRWRLAIDEINYGYDWSRSGIDLPTPDGGEQKSTEFKISADRGWQATDIILNVGTKLRIEARDQIVVAREPKPWISYPDGVTIEYFEGRPLGRLIATVLPVETKIEKLTSTPIVYDIGASTEMIATQAGRLFFKIVDDPAKLADNSGEYLVRVAKIE